MWRPLRAADRASEEVVTPSLLTDETLSILPMRLRWRAKQGVSSKWLSAEARTRKRVLQFTELREQPTWRAFPWWPSLLLGHPSCVA